MSFRAPLWLGIAAVLGCSSLTAQEYSFDAGQAYLKKYCGACHTGKSAVGGFHLDRVADEDSLLSQTSKWTSLVNRIRNFEMPPKGAPAASLDENERFSRWAENAIRAKVCAERIVPGPGASRRLNRDEYAATVRDLLDMHLDIAQALPADGAGGEGFDNALETLFLSPLHSEKYMDAAKFAMDFARKEFKSRQMILVSKPGPDKTPEQAVREILQRFLPRAFRRPVKPEEIEPYLDLFRAANKQGQNFEESVFYMLRAALVSPNFLFRVEPPNTTGKVQPLGQYALASRISYFVWGSMPDEFLFDLAAQGKLHDPGVIKYVVRRMLRNDRAHGFAKRFIEQWLHTRELTGDKAPDAKLFPAWATDEELRSDIRLQPVLFFQEMLIRDISLLDLLDSKYTIGTSNLAKHYGVKLPLNQGRTKQPQWVELPDGSGRGGLLGMSAVLTVSSFPYRTSPVLRGTWILESLLGTPPPPPPPDVPALEEVHDAAAAKTVRERLEQHRANPTCASCHARIDPLGFALENYDVMGRWREEESGKPVDNTGQLMDGTVIKGPQELKKALLDRKEVFIRNLTGKMLGYALGRGLTIRDSCTVDAIVEKLRENNYSSQTLIEAVVMSVPFRYQAVSRPVPAAAGQGRKETP
jgi:hypothetical protein